MPRLAVLAGTEASIEDQTGLSVGIVEPVSVDRVESDPNLTTVTDPVALEYLTTGAEPGIADPRR